MFAIGAIRYRSILAHRGGPVARLVGGTTTILGRQQFQVCAWLRPELGGNVDTQLFGGAAGTGTAPSMMVARFMAISEALERWAHRACATAAAPQYGFEVDPSSNGMAAFPGLTTRPVRLRARQEAFERLALLSWWERGTTARRCATAWPEVNAVELAAPDGVSMVIVHTRSAQGHFAYGHAAAADFAAACRRAVVEMCRHDHVVRKRLGQLEAGAAPPLTSVLERRAWYFSTPAGHARFLEAVRRAERSALRPEVDLVFDGEIPGPWTKYADVWRVACRMPSRRFLTDQDDYFFW